MLAHADQWCPPPLLRPQNQPRGADASPTPLRAQLGFATRCNAWSSGYPTLASPTFTGAGCALQSDGTVTNLATCCAAFSQVVGAVNGAPATSMCLCDAESAAILFNIVGAGNAPLGKASSYLGGDTGVLQQCVDGGLAQDVYWPTGDPTNPNDCANVVDFDTYMPNTEGVVFPPSPLLGSTRVPYPMSVTSTSAIIRWRTAGLTATAAWCGTSTANVASCATADIITGAATTIDHYAQLTGLTPNTVYFYNGARTAALVHSAADASADLCGCACSVGRAFRDAVLQDCAGRQHAGQPALLVRKRGVGVRARCMAAP